MTWPTPHPIYVVVGNCQCFCLGMGHLLLLILPPWWFWQYFGPSCPLCWSCSETLHDQWGCGGHEWVIEPSCVLWTSLQKSCQIPQCILHSLPCHTWTCRSLHSFAGLYLYLWGVPGGSWLCCHLWNASPPHVFADVLAAFTHALDIWDNYGGLVVTASFVACIDCPLISVFLSL